LKKRLCSISLLARSPQHPTSPSAFQTPSASDFLGLHLQINDDHNALLMSRLQGVAKLTDDCTAVMHALEHEVQERYIYIDKKQLVLFWNILKPFHLCPIIVSCLPCAATVTQRGRKVPA
jgi:hypothetical protein